MPASKQKPLVSIVGTTATGKTKLALELARRLLKSGSLAGIDLISADSRQVYKGLEVLSGADIPKDLDPRVKIHGVSILEPNQDWSVFHFQQLALPIIEQAWQSNRLPIVVGGTGLYHKHLFNEDMEIQSQPNDNLRRRLEQLSVAELQVELKSLDPGYFEDMNESDVKNPRRLIRAIERKSPPTDSETKSSRKINKPDLYIKVGLKLDLIALRKKIEKRVRDRFEGGAIDEVKKLKNNLPSFAPAMTATGVTQILDYLEDKISDQDCQANWSSEELQYAKRQITWWKKEPNIKWFSVNEENWLDDAINFVSDQLFH